MEAKSEPDATGWAEHYCEDCHTDDEHVTYIYGELLFIVLACCGTIHRAYRGATVIWDPVFLGLGPYSVPLRIHILRVPVLRVRIGHRRRDFL